MPENGTIIKTVSMYADEWDIVEKVAATKDYLFQGNRSQALRYIVRKFAEYERNRSGVRVNSDESDNVTASNNILT